MIVALRVALRDLRRGGRGLVLLAVCLFLGTAALAGIGSLSASILGALDEQGRQMLGGDLELRVSQRRATVEEAAVFASVGRTSETLSMRAMAARAGRAPLLIDLRGVDTAWPLVGAFRTTSDAVAVRPHGREIALAPAAGERLGVRVGDRVKIGLALMRVVGFIGQEPDRLGAGFTLGPPALVDLAGLDATALIQPGSLYESRYRILLAEPAKAKAIGARLLRRFPNAGWSVRTSDEAASGLKRGLAQLGQFLLLIGLAALAIAGVGIGGGVSAYLDTKTRTIAVLKTLGAPARMVSVMLLTQLTIVAMAGVLAGLAVGAGTPWIVKAVAGAALPVPPRLAIYPAPLAIAAALALLVMLLAALPALARARRIPAARLLRSNAALPRIPDPTTIIAMVVVAVAIAALAIVTASERTIARNFVAATATLLGLLWLLGLAIRAAVRRVPRPRYPLLRLALANLHRPGAQTDRLVLALGLGFSLFVALATINTSLTAELTGAAPAKAPRFFAIDLQPEDESRFRRAIETAAPGARIEATPSLRGSIVALKGVPVADLKGLPASAWIVRGDRTITWSARVPPRNAIVAGQWWPANYRGAPLVSIEAAAASALGLKVGDTITVSVLGVDVPARIAALRKIEWGALGLNFAIVFSPGYIEEAPHSLLASIYAPPDRDGAIATRLAAVLPWVTLIRTGDVIGRIGEILGQLAIAIRIAAAITVAAGIAVLIGTVASAEQSRRYDAVLLKLLGGTSRQVLIAQAIEYLLLALILLGVASGIGGVAGWLVVRQVLDLSWSPDWRVVAGTLAAASTITLGVGIAGSLPVLRARTAAALREL